MPGCPRLGDSDSSFNLVTCTEVFEHVPNDMKGFSGVNRILTDGGYFILTIPLGSRKRTMERAFLKDNIIEHRLKPEYHNDRVRGRNKVLAFRSYGTDIVDRLRSVQFSAEIKKIDSEANCIEDEYVVIARK
jgi:ubiquinone/menaquinone biosynthesis C-methylase UbiE